MSVLDDIVDWFKKAKEAKKEKQEGAKKELPNLGFMGKNSSGNAYKEAQQALAENDNE